MHLEINPQLRERTVGATLGIVPITHTRVTMYDELLWKQIEELCQHISREYKLENLSQHPHIAAVRELQKHDPQPGEERARHHHDPEIESVFEIAG